METGNSPLTVKNLRNLVHGIEICNGDEYFKEEFLVYAVFLLNFVLGEVLNEIPLNTQLLFTAGKVVGNMDRNLKVGENRHLIDISKESQTNKKTK